jgi:hypothetical protein
MDIFLVWYVELEPKRVRNFQLQLVLFIFRKRDIEINLNEIECADKH